MRALQIRYVTTAAVALVAAAGIALPETEDRKHIDPPEHVGHFTLVNPSSLAANTTAATLPGSTSASEPVDIF